MTRIPVSVTVGDRPPCRIGEIAITSPDEAASATARLLRAVADVIDSGANLEELADRPWYFFGEARGLR